MDYLTEKQWLLDKLSMTFMAQMAIACHGWPVN